MPQRAASPPALLSLFILLVAAGGLGGFAGSVVGAAFGKNALFGGGILGGLISSALAAFLAGRLKWIEPTCVKATAIGAALGFLAAMGVAVSTLSTPVGPLLSPLLVGAGGVAGYRFQARRAPTRVS